MEEYNPYSAPINDTVFYNKRYQEDYLLVGFLVGVIFANIVNSFFESFPK